MNGKEKLTVFYDGACPVCRKEIGYYKTCDGADQITWTDLTDLEGEVAPGLSKDKALARFHVMDETGGITSGSRAFGKLWVTLPGFKYLGRFVQIWPITQIAEIAYRLFLKIRPLWLKR